MIKRILNPKIFVFFVVTILVISYSLTNMSASASSSSCYIVNGNQNLIISFGGIGFGRIKPFEFLNTLQHIVPQYSKRFYLDFRNDWYHQGIVDISTDIETTLMHLAKVIQPYHKTIFMGCSAGGYAAILFGSLLKVDTVIAFIPQTVLERSSPYANLKPFINSTTQYYLYGDPMAPEGVHHFSQCANIAMYPNVEIIKKNNINLKAMRDSGELYSILLSLLQSS